MKTLFIAALLIAGTFSHTSSNAQTVKKATLQASGLTCSMCSNAINKALRSISYVENVKANIQASSFDISFKPGSKVDFDELKKKVEGAGFAVANLTATIDFDNAAIANDQHINSGGITFHFLNVKDQVLSGPVAIRILDKGFLTAKEFKKNSQFTKKVCYQTGVSGNSSCCSKDGIAAGTRIYHVTI